MNMCSFSVPEKGLWPEVCLRLYFSEKLPLSKKLRYFTEGRFSECFIYQHFSIARNKVGFYAK